MLKLEAKKLKVLPFCLGLAFFGLVSAQELPAPPQSASAVVAAGALPGTGNRTVTLDLKALGAWGPIQMKGTNSRRILGFNIRSDETILSAKLHLGYNFSPVVRESISQFRVSLNGKAVSVDRLVRAQSSGVRRTVDLDPKLFARENELNLSFISLSDEECDNPNAEYLWLTLSDPTRLELTVGPKPLSIDLKHLPEPFFDRRDHGRIVLPFVFSAKASRETLRAGGVLASWFGIQAGAKGIQFPSYFDELPQSSLVLFLRSGEELQGIKAPSGSNVSVVAHPQNPNLRVLVVSGQSDEEIVRAARSLTLTHGTLIGQSVGFPKDIVTGARKPNDAPAWIRTDRPMRFGELVKAEELISQTPSPEVMRFNFRVSPEVFTWRSQGAPLKIKYRASRLPTHTTSTLNVLMNDKVVDSIAINDRLPQAQSLAVTQGKDPSVREASFFAPPFAGKGRDQLQFVAAFDPFQIAGRCQPWIQDNLIVSVDPDSTVDFSSFPKFVAMPNLAHFTSLGYPFTKMADLSETAVVIPDRATPEEISTYFDVLGRMGESTGYPSIGHQLSSTSDVARHADKDLLVIASSKSQKLFSDWAAKMPLIMEGDGRRIREPQVSWRAQYRWEENEVDPLQADRGNINLTGIGKVAALLGFESPLAMGRSVVMFYAENSEEILRLTDAMFDPEKARLIQGDLVVVNDRRVQHTRAADPYFIGELPITSKIRWFFADHPLVVAILALLAALGFAALLYRPLRMIVSRKRSTT